MNRWMSVLIVLAATPTLLARGMQDAQAKPEEKQMATTQPAAGGKEYVKLETTLGDIVLELDAAKAPITTKNFLGYVDSKFYVGTIFHRVISTFMIQGGGYLEDMTEKKDGLQPPIQNEWQNGLKNVRGSIAMARLGGKPDSASAQFFINVVDNAPLDTPRDGAGYAVFGRVVGGMDVVDKIKATEVQEHPKLKGMGAVVPKTPVVIKGTTRVPAAEGQALSKKAEQAAAEAKEAAEKPLKEFVAKVEQETGKKFEKTASGLMYMVLQEGTGASPKPTDTVEVHYTGTFFDGKKFDSSVDRGTPATFRLDGVIKGWTEGVSMMKVGEKRKLICPPDLAYGAAGRPGIPPNSTLVFDVELLSIKTPQ